MTLLVLNATKHIQIAFSPTYDTEFKSGCLVVPWSGCPAVWLSGFLVFQLYGCLVVWLSNCLVVLLCGCLVVWLSSCLVVWLLGYVVVQLSGCLVVGLSGFKLTGGGSWLKTFLAIIYEQDILMFFF